MKKDESKLDKVVGKPNTQASTCLSAWHTLQSTFSEVPSPVWAYRLLIQETRTQTCISYFICSDSLSPSWVKASPTQLL